MGSREPRNDWPLHLFSNHANGFSVTWACDWEPRLDDIHAQSRQLLCDLKLLGGVESYARGLFAVPESGVEDDYSV
jgi:hypothetical protein